MQKVITDDLDALLGNLPDRIRRTLSLQEDMSELLEVVLDLGRLPEARFPHREMVLDEKEVTEADLDFVVSRISAFGDDNRAGITRTLHRISALRNRKGRIVGLTLRVGRAVFGTIQIIDDLVQSGKSVLLLLENGTRGDPVLQDFLLQEAVDPFSQRLRIHDTQRLSPVFVDPHLVAPRLWRRPV